MSHPDHDALLRYRFDTLSRDEGAQLAEHLRRCAECTARYAEVCRQVDSLQQYEAEPEDPEAMVRRALGSVAEQRATAPEPPARKATPYPGSQPAVAAPAAGAAPGDEGTPVLVWLGWRPGAPARAARLAAAAALVLAAVYAGGGAAYYALHRVKIDTRLAAEGRWLAGSDATAEVRVVSAETQAPLEGAAAELSLRCGEHRYPLAQVRTGADGSASPAFTVPPDVSGECALEVQASAAGERDTAQLRLAVLRQLRIHLATDKPLYQPGQTIQIRALALQHPSQLPAEGQTLAFEVRDEKGNRLTREERTLGRFGVASLPFQLADDVPLGQYAISASVGGAEPQTLAVKVDRYALPKFSVSVAPEKDAYLAGETLRATVHARYFFGKPVGRAEVHALLATPNGLVIGQEISGRTTEDGELRVQAELPATLAAGGSESVVLQVQVKDAAGQEERHEQTVAVSRQTLAVDVLAAGDAVSPGQDNDLYVLTSTPDGRPVAASVELADRVTGETFHALTGARGVARVRVRPSSAAVYDVAAESSDGRKVSRVISLPARPSALSLLADRALYRPGEKVKAEVQVRAGSGVDRVQLLAVRDGQTVLRQEAAVRDDRATFELALPPGLTGSLDLLAGQAGDDRGAHGRSSRWIAVAEPRALSVSIAPDQPEYRPGTEARLRFEVRDAQGRPAAASLGVAVVDQSLFARVADVPQQARAAFLLERGMLAPRHGLSAAEVLSSGDWTEEEQAAASALFSLTAAEPPPALQREQTLPAKQQALAAEKSAFDERAGKARLGAGLAVALIALAGLLRAKLGLGGRLGAAAIAFAGTWLALDVPWFAGLVFLGALLVVARRGGTTAGAGAVRALRLVAAALVLALATVGAVVLLMERHADTLGELAELSVKQRGEESGHREPFGAQSVAPQMRMMQLEPAPSQKPGASRKSGFDALLGAGSGFGGLGAGDTIGLGPAGHAAAAPAPPRRIARVRESFPETMFFRPEVIADERGVAELTVPLADSITAWRVSAFASSAAGKIGAAQLPLKVFQDFFVDVDAPPALVQGDEAELPVAVYNYLSERQTVRVEVQKEDWFELLGPRTLTASVAPGGLEGRAVRIRALKPGRHKLTLRADGTRLSDAVARELLVSERGRQVVDAFSGEATPRAPVRRSVVVPDQVAASTLTLKLYPTRTALALDGLEGSLQMPHGCFEQTSSTHYPNVLIYESLKRSGHLTPELEQRARGFISAGYQRLLTFEVPGGGFEWFGRAPANQVLTAYGLLELSDMARLFPVDPQVIARTQRFLLARQTADGSWNPDQRSISDGLWRSEYAGRVAVTAYVAWALAESGARGPSLDRALSFLAAHLEQTDDAYADALATAAFAKAGHGSAGWAARRLAARAAHDETRVRFAPAGATVYYGRGAAGAVETTALAEQALRGADVEPALQRGALEYLLSARDGRGAWRSTQATILALRALLLGAEPERDAAVRVKVNGADAGTFTLHTASTDPTVIELGPKARRGQNLVEVEADRPVAYQLLSSYVLPWRQRGDEASEPLSLDVAYGRTSLRVGDVLPVTVKLTYRRPDASGMAMVQLGLPPGLAPVLEDLAALRAAGKVARYEPDARVLSLYLDRLAQGAPLELSLRLKARGRVRTSGVESRAYLYYAPEISAAAPPTAVAVN